MMMLMEEMYYELELVEELNIDPATLKRFLVSTTIITFMLYATFKKKCVLSLLSTPISFIVKGARELQKQSVPQLPAQLLRHTDDVCSDPRLQTVQTFVQERSLCTHHGLHLP